MFKKLLTKTIAVTLVLAMAGFGLVGNPRTTQAQFNPEINYQGKLFDPVSGGPVADGDYDIVFRLYTASTGGSAIWTESRTGGNDITITDGLFSVMLGDVSSLASVDWNQPLWLGVTVESDSEMTPRKPLGAVPAAFVADTLDGIDSEGFVRSDADDEIESGNTLTVTGTLDTNGDVSFADADIAFDGAATNFTTTGNFSINTNQFQINQATGVTTVQNGLVLGANVQLSSDTITDFTGTGLTLSSGALGLTNTGVAANTYGSASQVPRVTVDAQGRITGVVNTNIAVNASAINAGTLGVNRGGTGRSSHTAFALIAGGTSSTGSQQSITNGATGTILKSAGTNALPVWGTLAASDIPNLDAAKITTGTFNNDRITGLTTADFASANVSQFTNDAGYLTSYSETDPVFSASPAGGITNTNISNWNTAYGWGDHAAVGYLTNNQTITLSGDVTGSGETAITTSLAVDSVGDDEIDYSAVTLSDFTNDAGFIDDLSGFDTDDLSEGSTNLYSQWTNEVGGVAYAGNVGINTTSLTQSLNVNGNIDLQADATIFVQNNSGNAFAITADGTSDVYLAINTSGTGDEVTIGLPGGDVYIGSTGNPANIVFEEGGEYINWGGTSGSTGYGIRDNAGTLQFKNNSGIWTDLGSGGGGSSVWSLNGSDAFYDSGNVGIGLNDPTSDLTVASTLGTIEIRDTDNANYITYLQQNAGNFIIDASSFTSGGLQFVTSATGVASFDVNNAQFDVNSDFIVNLEPTGGNPEFTVQSNGSAIFEVFGGSLDATAIGAGVNITNTAKLQMNGNISFRNTGGAIYFGDTYDATGYGIRDNAGTMQFKNSGGNWTNLGGGGSSTYLSLTDTPASFTASAIPYTNTAGNAILHSANLDFNGSKLEIGGTSSVNGQLSILSEFGTEGLNYNSSNGILRVGDFSAIDGMINVINAAADQEIALSNNYITFNSTPTASGFGFRNNAGTIQFKNSGGAWSNLGGPWTTTGSDIYYDSGNVGIGTSNPSSNLNVVKQNSLFAASTTYSNLLSEYAVAPSSNQASSTINTSLNGRATISSSNSNLVGRIIGVSGQINDTSSGSVTSAYGGSFGYVKDGSGTTSNAYGVQATTSTTSRPVTDLHGIDSNLFNAGGSISNAYGLRTAISNFIGNVNNAYGLYVGSINGTNTWGIYQSNPANKNYLAGNVGIGIASPEAKLDISGTSALDGTAPVVLRINDTRSSNSFTDGALLSSIDFSSDDPGFDGTRGRIGLHTEGVANNFNQMSFSVYGGSSLIEAMRINRFGQVGMGTIGPSAKLHVVDATNQFRVGYDASNYANLSVNSGGSFNFDSTGNMNFNVGGGTLNIGTASLRLDNNRSIRWQDSGSTTRGILTLKTDNDFEIGSTGIGDIYFNDASNVGVGTAAPGAKLDVNGTIRQLSATSCSLDADANGDIICTASDENLKTKKQNVQNALGIISGLNPLYYNWKDTSRFGTQREIGFLAQEVLGVLPEAVTDTGDYLSLNYGKISALNTQGIKELDIKINEESVRAAETRKLAKEAKEAAERSVNRGTMISKAGASVAQVLDSIGAVIENGRALFAQLFVREVNVVIDTDKETPDPIGSFVFENGDTEITIENSFITEDSKIMLTPRGLVSGFFLAEVRDGEFDVQIARVNDNDVVFDYWIIGVVTEDTIGQPSNPNTTSPHTTVNESGMVQLKPYVKPVESKGEDSINQPEDDESTFNPETNEDGILGELDVELDIKLEKNSQNNESMEELADTEESEADTDNNVNENEIISSS